MEKIYKARKSIRDKPRVNQILYLVTNKCMKRLTAFFFHVAEVPFQVHEKSRTQIPVHMERLPSILEAVKMKSLNVEPPYNKDSIVHYKLSITNFYYQNSPHEQYPSLK